MCSNKYEVPLAHWCKTIRRKPSSSVDMTFGRIRLFVDATFCPVPCLVEENSQVRQSVEIVNTIILDKKMQDIFNEYSIYVFWTGLIVCCLAEICCPSRLVKKEL